MGVSYTSISRYHMDKYTVFFLGSIVIWPDPNLNLSCARQSDAGPFCEDYKSFFFK